MSPAQLEKIRAMFAADKEKRIREGRWSAGIKAHTEYQTNPVGWLVDKLGIPEHMIRWSLNPDYERCFCPRCTTLGNAGQPHIWDGDVDPLAKSLELLSEGKSVAVSSGTTTGKTHSLGAGGTLWFLAAFQDSVVYSIAPKQELLLKNMWKEIGRMWPRFKSHFPKAQLLTGNLRMRDEEGQQEIWAATAFGAGVGADEELAGRLKGFHAEKMLWIIEEMQSVDRAMVETIVKTSSSDFNPIMGMGNPAHQQDELARFGRRDWVTPIRISALDFPNVVCGEPIIPGGRSRVSVVRDLSDADGDEAHPLYLTQVRGIAPAESAHALIRWAWCEAAAERYNDPAFRDGPQAIGVDVANSEAGDKAAIARGLGACLTEVEDFQCPNASDLGVRVHGEATDNRINPLNVGVDSIGVGASTVNKLKELQFFARWLNGSAKPELRIDEDIRYSDGDDPDNPTGPVVMPEERYYNLRSQMWWRMREDLRLGRIALPKDQALWQDLTIPTFKIQNGKILVEAKDAIVKRLKRSPNKGDAAVYWCFVRSRRPQPAEQEVAQPKGYDSHFEEVLASYQQDGDAFSRRPF